MNVKLIAATVPIIEGVNNIDELIAYAARVTYRACISTEVPARTVLAEG